MKSIFNQILLARVYDHAVHTPLQKAESLSKELKNHIYLKREDLQTVFSFKIRGAYNKIANLSKQEQAKGVICSSAGNHGQGVALSAKKLGIQATVVMPVTTPPIKIDAVKNFGAHVVLRGDNYSEASDYCSQLASELDQIYIHPFDDPLVIAGQGTIGKEILQDCPEVDLVFVPIGGGGLAAGVACFLKELKPEIRIIGVEPSDSNAMTLSVRKGERIKLPHVGIFADGVAVKQVGENTFNLCRKLIDDFVEVTTDEICSAMKKNYQETRTILEPAGALSLAGMITYLRDHKIEGKNAVAINSGANLNFQRMQFIAERAQTGELKEQILAIHLPEERGALTRLCRTALAGKSITEFNYRSNGKSRAVIFVGIHHDDEIDWIDLATTLKQLNYSYEDFTDNELAKQHVRHMVGGIGADVKDEVLYRFLFPERSNALGDFLGKLGSRWNISLFQYRSYGNDFGRVLMGLQVPPKELDEFKDFVQDLDMQAIDESENHAYKLFLQAPHQIDSQEYVEPPQNSIDG